jgi:nitrite reductase/ring-hydroxylating ferredoxin subunit
VYTSQPEQLSVTVGSGTSKLAVQENGLVEYTGASNVPSQSCPHLGILRTGFVKSPTLITCG